MIPKTIFAEIIRMNQNNINPKNHSKFKIWLKRVGIGGLIFFTAKGILWLIIFYYGADAIFGSCSQK